MLELCLQELSQVYTHFLSDKLGRGHENTEISSVCDSVMSQLDVGREFSCLKNTVPLDNGIHFMR